MATKFSFRFESILKLKEKEEESKKANLGIASKSLRQEEDQLTNLINQKTTMTDEIRSKSNSKLQIKDLQFFASKMQFVDQLISKQKVTVEVCEKKVDNCRVQLMEAKKQNKVFNILKEKDYEEYNYAQLKEEEMLLDQLVSYKTASK